MKAIKVDKNLDIVVVAGKVQFVYGIDVIKQNCVHVIKQIKGELNYSSDTGIDYFDNVFSGSINIQRFEAQARKNINNVDGVISITSFKAYQASNALCYKAVIKTIYGGLTVDETI